jgi:hypothetical protein
MNFILKDFKKKYIAIIISFLISFFFIILSLNHKYWVTFFQFFSVPPALPAFSDFDAIVRFLKCYESGLTSINDFCPEVIKGTFGYYDYPELWLYIFKFLNLSSYYNFLFVAFIVLFLYFNSLFHISTFISRPKDKLIFFAAILSTSNFLLIERLNVDVIIFLLLFCLILNINFIIKFFLFFLAILLKIYPVFSVLIFLNKKINFFIALLISFLALLILKDYITKINNILLEFATTFAYGSRSISKAIYFLLSTRMSYFITPANYKFLTYSLEIFFLFFSTIFIIFGFLSKQKENLNLNLVKLFILGSSIYIYTFIFGSNADYRLIFLFLTLPYILNYFNYKTKSFFLICLLISLNSFFFTVNDRFSLFYIITGFLVYLCKLIILMFLSFTLGVTMSKYLFKFQYQKSRS